MYLLEYTIEYVWKSKKVKALDAASARLKAPANARNIRVYKIKDL